jgi:hypothetical protein
MKKKTFRYNENMQNGGGSGGIENLEGICIYEAGNCSFKITDYEHFIYM